MACLEKTHLCATRGDTYEAQVIWKDSNGDPIDLTGYTIEFDVTVGGDTTTYTDGDGLTVTEVDGQIDILIDSADTALWVSNAVFKLTATSPGLIVTTLMYGVLEVTDAG